MTSTSTRLQRASRFAKLAFRAQIFLLRHNWMGSMGNYIMVITTTGRKSGKRFTTPVGYQQNGDTILSFNVNGTSNWYKNLAQNPMVTLEIKKQTYQMRGVYVTNADEIRQIFELYRREQPTMLPRFFGISTEASTDDLIKAADRIKFVRFHRD
jgi:deazaflavin-dependent oxidoreductase (nitroreductase family)